MTQPVMTDTLSPPPSVAAIYTEIRSDIILMRLMPGARVSENELARRFGTSRTPVREALLRLADEGLIEVWPQRGTYISRISLRSVRRARFVRLALEVAIFRQAALTGLTDTAWAELEDAIRLQREGRDRPEAFTAADDMLHRTIADGIGMGDVWAVLEREKAQFDRMRFLSLPNVTPVQLLIDQHLAMIEAIRQGDPEAAETAVRRHLSESEKAADELLRRHPGYILQDI